VSAVKNLLANSPVRTCFLILFAWLLAVPSPGPAKEKSDTKSEPQFVDLSLLVAPDMPCTWPANFPLFQINHYQRIGPLSAYNSDILAIDGNTGTQLDFPPHSIPLPKSKLPNAGPPGRMFGDKVPAWQFVGEACVIDCRKLLDTAPNGRSDLVKKEHVKSWEKKHRPVGPGDVVLFYSGYSDKYYKPFPAGRRFIAEPLEKKAPAWPDPDPDCMDYLGRRKVMSAGTDSPSMGPIPDLAEPTHIAGLKYGMIWTEGATGLAKLPPTGAFYCMLGPKHAGSPYTEARAFAIVGDPLAGRLIASARAKRVVDLSVSLSADLPVTWPGAGVGRHRHPYMETLFMFVPALNRSQSTHTLDSHSGTHLVPPAYALPSKGFDNHTYAPKVQKWLTAYEKIYGPRATSDITTEKVPIQQTCGRARVIDVKHLIGTTDKTQWPRSPEIGPADIKKYEAEKGRLQPGDIVIFHSGHSDKYFRPFPKGEACLADPLNGKTEGWPAPTADAILLLAQRGVRCVASDGPTLGGVEPRRALMTYWTLGRKGIVGVEFLTNVGKVPDKAYFIFAAVKIRGCHGGPGRAIALY
jgi:kynurenine formamidase